MFKFLEVNHKASTTTKTGHVTARSLRYSGEVFLFLFLIIWLTTPSFSAINQPKESELNIYQISIKPHTIELVLVVKGQKGLSICDVLGPLLFG